MNEMVKHFGYVTCFKCHGRKWVHNDKMTGSVDCPSCKGTGVDEARTEQLKKEHEKK